jgi:hypothetical protein
VCGVVKCSLVVYRSKVGLHSGIGTEEQRVDETPRNNTNPPGSAKSRLAYQNNFNSDKQVARSIATIAAACVVCRPRATSHRDLTGVPKSCASRR